MPIRLHHAAHQKNNIIQCLSFNYGQIKFGKITHIYMEFKIISKNNINIEILSFAAVEPMALA